MEEGDIKPGLVACDLSPGKVETGGSRTQSQSWLYSKVQGQPELSEIRWRSECRPWWYMPIISALRRQWQKDCNRFKASQDETGELYQGIKDRS